MEQGVPATSGLRSEAFAIESWGRLSDEQRRAFRRVASAVEYSLKQLAEESSAEGGPRRGPDAWLSRQRLSRTLFLDGSRGAGKTTLLLSLIRATAKGELADAPSAVQQLLQPLKGRLVWLEPLDLEPAPRSLNLLAALLARIEDAIRLYQAEPVRAGLGEAGGEGPYARSALEALQGLEAAMATAWNGNLPERAGRLDLDSYAVEVLRTERSRLRVNPTFTDVLERLAREVFRTRELEDPLFILPVDDVDLHPSASLQVLRLMRMIWGPRLLFLVLGDLGVLRLMVNLHYARDLGTLGGEAPIRFETPFEPRHVAPVTRRIADNSLRKLVPPSQRIGLGPMSHEEAFEFRPRGGREGPTLGDLLEEVEVPSPFYHPQGFYGVRLDDLRKFVDFEDFPYSGRNAFRAVPRIVADCWSRLSDSLPSDRWAALREHARELVAERVTEDAGQVFGRIESLEEQLDEERIAGLQVASETAAPQIFERVTQCRVRVSAHRRWRMNVSEFPLSKETAAALVLFRDLDSVLKPELGPLIDPAAPTRSWAVTQWQAGSTSVELSWPAPPVGSVWELELFLSRWSTVIEGPGGKEPVSLAFAWLSAGVALLDRDPILQSLNPEEPDWKLLWRRIVNLERDVAMAEEPLQRRARAWIEESLVFLMPEGFGHRPGPIRPPDDPTDARAEILELVERSLPSLQRLRYARLRRLEAAGLSGLARDPDGLFEALTRRGLEPPDAGSFLDRGSDGDRPER